MSLARQMEREKFLAHDARMRLPVKELFPRPKGFSRTMSCKHCHTEFTWTPRDGKVTTFCSGRCRDAHAKGRP